jgi:hypothetical protein
MPDLTKLARTASHKRWGDVRGFDATGARFLVDTVDGRKLAFDTTTGALAH